MSVIRTVLLNVLLLTVNATFTIAQGVGEFKGVIVNERQEPVPYVNIRTTQLTAGTVSNEDGRFLLKIAQTNLQDTLILSCIGYSTGRISLTELSQTVEKTITLSSATVLLNELVITPISGLDLVKKALTRISENYQNQPFMMDGFYRESIEQNDKLISLVEAIISVHKSSYVDFNASDQMKLKKGRKAVDENESEILKHMTISGGLRVDLVKYGSHFLVSQNFNLYDYTLKESLTDGKQDTVFVVEFDQKDALKLPLLKGKIYIDKQNYAIAGVEYGYSPKGIEYLNQYDRRQRKDMKKVNMYLESKYALTTVTYARLLNKWYLQQARSVHQFQVTDQKKEKSIVWYKADISITEIDLKNIQSFKKEEELITFGVSISKQMEGTYDQKFWENYNYIVPAEGAKKKAGILLKN